jgi:hypothetical protein
MSYTRVSSGLPGLDRMLDDLRLGDNVVWQVDNIDDYRHFALFLVREALAAGRRMVYLRFGQHEPIIPPVAEFTANPRFYEYKIDAGLGFETFSAEIHGIIAREGEEVYYVFDCLSDLLPEWSTDLMVGNFFYVTCPYLFKLKTIAYFGILRERHSYQTIARIRDTTQILLDVFHKDYFCIHPLKVWQRYSVTMFLPHISTNDGRDFAPLTSSTDITELYSLLQYKVGKTERKLDYWDRIFIKAAELEEAAKDGDPRLGEQKRETLEQLLRMVIGRDQKILKLALRYMSVSDLLQIKSRLIGSGFIGGKAVGLLLARAILAKDPEFHWSKILEPHDSFYIGSDVYYTFLVQNDCWQLRLDQKKPENYFPVAVLLKNRIKEGDFPEIIRDQFLEMLEYFGQAPIIVRSSSLLEDSFGNAFAGEYDSVFCANQGNLNERYQRFLEAVRQVYSSSMNEDALAYRINRGLAQSDEQMALLVQRVSGGQNRSYFFPDTAGVALSYNLYVWRPDMDPTAGMLRMVLGLGTRAVDRVEEDYARFVPLDKPEIRPEAGLDEQKAHSQHEVDVIDLAQNELIAVPFHSLVNQKLVPHLSLVATRDYSRPREVLDFTPTEERWYLSFEALLGRTSFPAIMRRMLHTLQTAYGYPVDTEFTCNFRSENDFLINLLQCRPFQVKCNQKRVSVPEEIPADRIIFATRGKMMGENLELQIQRIIYVVPEKYAALTQSEQYEVARLIGKLNQLTGLRSEGTKAFSTILLGPGRWGSSTPSLGIPVSFAEINKFAVLGEIAFTTSGFVPELSYGTHFFQNLIENNVFYIMLEPTAPGNDFQPSFFTGMPNQLTILLPEAERWREVVRVVHEDQLQDQIWIHTEITEQKAVCWLRPRPFIIH